MNKEYSEGREYKRRDGDRKKHKENRKERVVLELAELGVNGGVNGTTRGLRLRFLPLRYDEESEKIGLL